MAEIEIPLRLVRLTSSLLPVGAFAYSRGLEYAAKAEWVKDGETLRSWIFGTLEHSFAPLDGALFLRMFNALVAQEHASFALIDKRLAVARETQELRQEDQRMAEAMSALLRDTGTVPSGLSGCRFETFAATYALAAFDLDVTVEAALSGFIWSHCEAQVAAALRLGIIGQAEGQRILADAPDAIVKCVEIADQTADDEIGNVSFMQAIGSALHETQYSRLFRS